MNVLKVSPYVYAGIVTPMVGRKVTNDNEVFEVIYKVLEMDTSITKQEIQGKSRSKRIREARQLFQYLCKHFTGCTLQQIGTETNKNHATVLHSINLIKDIMSYNKKLIVKVVGLKAEINRIIQISQEQTIK